MINKNECNGNVNKSRTNKKFELKHIKSYFFQSIKSNRIGLNSNFYNDLPKIYKIIKIDKILLNKKGIIPFLKFRLKVEIDLKINERNNVNKCLSTYMPVYLQNSTNLSLFEWNHK